MSLTHPKAEKPKPFFGMACQIKKVKKKYEIPFHIQSISEDCNFSAKSIFKDCSLKCYYYKAIDLSFYSNFYFSKTKNSVKFEKRFVSLVYIIKPDICKKSSNNQKHQLE